MKKIPVPKLKQKEKLTCGPSALLMVLKYYGEKLSEEEIKEKIGGTKKSYGVRTTSLADFARNLDYKVDCYTYNKTMAKGKAKMEIPSPTKIIKFLEKGIPVILAVNSSLLYDKPKFTSIGHFIVLTKYEKGKFWYNDPAKGKERTIEENKLIFSLSNNVMNSSAYLLAIKNN